MKRRARAGKQVRNLLAPVRPYYPMYQGARARACTAQIAPDRIIVVRAESLPRRRAILIRRAVIRFWEEGRGAHHAEGNFRDARARATVYIRDLDVTYTSNFAADVNHSPAREGVAEKLLAWFPKEDDRRRAHWLDCAFPLYVNVSECIGSRFIGI